MIKIRGGVPGRKSRAVLNKLTVKSGGGKTHYPLVFSGKGKGSYCEDIDGNVFLDFASQIASNPMGYNHPEMLKVVKKYANRFPVKFAGQDFAVKEHLNLIEHLLSVSPGGMNSAFLVNSGAEAVENAIKICMRRREKAKFSVSVAGAFHGRTLGALSLHHSNPIHRKGYFLEPNRELPFTSENQRFSDPPTSKPSEVEGEYAGDVLREMVKERGKESVAFVILEHFQGEGGYRIPSSKMIKGLYKVCKKNKIPYVSDEVQAGMGRTGKWWAFEHYGIKPDVFSSAKALQVGATVASKKIFPRETGAISSTWGGGSLMDLALGIKTIELIKQHKLLKRNVKMGDYLMSGLKDVKGVSDVRGRGLMVAFDLESRKVRDKAIFESGKRGLLILGAGEKSIRVIPPFVVSERSIDQGIGVLKDVVRKVC